jgi:hypothetical protein
MLIFCRISSQIACIASLFAKPGPRAPGEILLNLWSGTAGDGDGSGSVDLSGSATGGEIGVTVGSKWFGLSKVDGALGTTSS